MIIQDTKSPDTLLQRSSVLQAADCLGYVPGLGLGIGAARAVAGFVVTIFAGFGYAATSLAKETAELVSKLRGIEFDGESLQAAKDTCNFIAQRGMDETSRGLYQEIILNICPGGSLLVDLYSEKLASKGPLATCARGSTIDPHTITYYTQKQKKVLPSQELPTVDPRFGDDEISDTNSNSSETSDANPFCWLEYGDTIRLSNGEIGYVL